MKKVFLFLVVSAKALAFDFHVAPSLSYVLTKDDFKEGVNTLQLKKSGAMIGVTGSVVSPFIKYNWINKAKGTLRYGVLDGTFTPVGSLTPVTNMKNWNMAFEDTMSFYARLNSKTAPYIGFGYDYTKYRFENPKSDIYPSAFQTTALETNSKLEGNNKRFYVPFGFLLHATDSFTLDFRYEKDFLKKINKSQEYLTGTRDFVQGQGFGCSATWDFSPANNTAVSIDYRRHDSKFSGKIGSNDGTQEKAENNVVLKLHWLGNN